MEKSFSFIPWRQDCGSYRLYNPASEIFQMDYPLQIIVVPNWCPGMVTNPIYIDLEI
jgi:hypothetical protein